MEVPEGWSYEAYKENAQALFSGGDYEGAAAYYLAAFNHEGTITNLQAAVSARGVGDANFRLGSDEGADEWHGVSEHYSNMAIRQAEAGDDVQALYDAKRESIVLGFSVGKVMLSRTVRLEQQGQAYVDVAQRARTSLMNAWEALDDVEANRPLGVGEMVRERPPYPDQYRINGVHAVALYHALYGDRREGRRIARQARKLAPRSESGELPTRAATMDKGYIREARHRARLRAVAATAIAWAPRRIGKRLLGQTRLINVI